MSGKNLVALLAGVLFGAGLLISGMTQTSKVLGFLDITGAWNPALALVMAGAIGVFLPGRLLFQRRFSQPILEDRYHNPDTNRVDARLILGAAMFGVGWGMSGVCPGPAIINAFSQGMPFVIFAAMMTVGMGIGHMLQRVRIRPENRAIISEADLPTAQ